MKNELTLQDEINNAMMETPREIIKRRVAGIPWYARGRGNKAARRCSAIVGAMVRSGSFGPQFDRLNQEGRGL